eukprot:1588633-Prymnesium_polylepis.2
MEERRQDHINVAHAAARQRPRLVDEAVDEDRDRLGETDGKRRELDGGAAHDRLAELDGGR